MRRIGAIVVMLVTWSAMLLVATGPAGGQEADASCVDRPVVAEFEGTLVGLTELRAADDANAVARVQDPEGTEIIVRVQGDPDLLDVGQQYQFALLDDIEAPYATVGGDDPCPPNDSIRSTDGSALEAGTPIVLRFLIVVAACAGAAAIYFTRHRRRNDADDEKRKAAPDRNHGRRMPWQR